MGITDRQGQIGWNQEEVKAYLKAVTEKYVGLVVTAENLPDMEKARREVPKLVVCDVMMPEVSGWDFYDEVGQLDPKLRSRIVFLSGGAFTERAQAFLDSVPNRRLSKPFDVDALTAVLLSAGDHDALP